MMYRKNKKLVLKGPAILCLVCVLSAGLRGQSSTPPPANPTPAAAPSSSAQSASAASSAKVTTLEKYTVSDVPITQQLLPTVRPVGDVMGDETNIIDIPRS